MSERIWLLLNESLQGVADAVRDRFRAAGVAIHEHVHEVARGSHDVVALARQLELVAHARVAELADAQRRDDRVRELDRGLELAMRLDAEADDAAAVDVESAGLDQVRVD